MPRRCRLALPHHRQTLPNLRHRSRMRKSLPCLVKSGWCALLVAWPPHCYRPNVDRPRSPSSPPFSTEVKTHQAFPQFSHFSLSSHIRRDSFPASCRNSCRQHLVRPPWTHGSPHLAMTAKTPSPPSLDVWPLATTACRRLQVLLLDNNEPPCIESNPRGLVVLIKPTTTLGCHCRH